MGCLFEVGRYGKSHTCCKICDEAFRLMVQLKCSFPGVQCRPHVTRCPIGRSTLAGQTGSPPSFSFGLGPRQAAAVDIARRRDRSVQAPHLALASGYIITELAEFYPRKALPQELQDKGNEPWPPSAQRPAPSPRARDSLSHPPPASSPDASRAPAAAVAATVVTRPPPLLQAATSRWASCRAPNSALSRCGGWARTRRRCARACYVRLLHLPTPLSTGKETREIG